MKVCVSSWELSVVHHKPAPIIQKSQAGSITRPSYGTRDFQLGCLDDMAPETVAPAMRLHFPISFKVRHAETRTVAWALRTYTTWREHSYLLDTSARAPARATACTQNACTPRWAAPHLQHAYRTGSLHTSGRSCASREGHTKTLPALPLLGDAKRKRGRRINVAAPQQHDAPIPSRDSPD